MLSNNAMIFLPLLLQVALTMVVFISLGVAKSRSLKAGTVDLERKAMHSDAWPDNVTLINNNIRNQFEVPILFYVLVFVFFALNAAGGLVQLLAWLFVLSRIVHAYIHTGSNHVPTRAAVFTFGCFIVIAMTGLAFWAVLSGAA